MILAKVGNTVKRPKFCMMKSKKLKRTKPRQKLVKPSVLAMDGFPDSKLALDWSVKKVAESIL